MIRCHTVPKFYLKFFVPNGQKCFWIYDKKGLAVRPQTPDNTLVIGDYYVSDPDEQGKKNAETEKALAVLESDVKPILEEWIARPAQPLNKQKDMQKVAGFLSLMYTRVPASVQLVSDMHLWAANFVREKFKESNEDHQLYIKKTGRQVSYEEYCKFLQDTSPEINDEKYMVRKSLSLSYKILHAMVQKHWQLIHIKHENFFVTSDAPLTIFVLKNAIAEFGDFSASDGHILFPLSSKVCLSISKRGIKSSVVSKVMVEQFNRRTIAMANQYVISPFKSNRINKCVKEFSYTFGQPRFDKDDFKSRLEKSLK